MSDAEARFYNDFISGMNQRSKVYSQEAQAPRKIALMRILTIDMRDS